MITSDRMKAHSLIAAAPTLLLLIVGACVGSDPAAPLPSNADASSLPLDGSTTPADATSTTDAGSEGDVVSASFCSTVDAARCEDFDRSMTVPGLSTTDLGTMNINSQSFVSSPSSLQVQLVDPQTTGFKASLAVLDVLAGGHLQVRVELDWRIDLLSAGNAGLTDLFIDRTDGVPGGAALHIESATDGGAPTLSFGPAFLPVPMPELQTWTHVTLGVEWPADGGTSATASVRIGSSPAVVTSISIARPRARSISCSAA